MTDPIDSAHACLLEARRDEHPQAVREGALALAWRELARARGGSSALMMSVDAPQSADASPLAQRWAMRRHLERMGAEDRDAYAARLRALESAMGAR